MCSYNSALEYLLFSIVICGVESRTVELEILAGEKPWCWKPYNICEVRVTSNDGINSSLFAPSHRKPVSPLFHRMESASCKSGLTLSEVRRRVYKERVKIAFFNQDFQPVEFPV